MAVSSRRNIHRVITIVIIIVGILVGVIAGMKINNDLNAEKDRLIEREQKRNLGVNNFPLKDDEP